MINDLVRKNIRNLRPYSSARDEFKGEASVFLDANENAFGSPVSFSDESLNRYPDPLQAALKQHLSHIKGIPPQNIFVGNGSDEAIDLLVRIFCEPGTDNLITCPPTYGMYEVSANINDVQVLEVPLLPSFALDVEQILEKQNERTKLLFLCSPNNPTGNSLHPHDMELLVQKFNGIVVIDEAYINYAKQPSAISLLTEYENVVVLQTFSKAWGLAGLRVGMAFANEIIIGLLNKVKPPYNISKANQQLAISALQNINWVNTHIRATVHQRNLLMQKLAEIPAVQKIHPSDANFILVEVKDADSIYNTLKSKGIIMRNRSKIKGCENCLRITVGTPDENALLIKEMTQL